jgi:hypothetical protein
MAFREWLLDEAAEFRAAPPIGFAGKHAHSRQPRAPRRRAKAS